MVYFRPKRPIGITRNPGNKPSSMKSELRIPKDAETIKYCEQLTERRKKLGLSRSKMARLMGIDQHQLYNWEWGILAPRPENREKLEAFFQRAEQGVLKQD